MVNNCIRKDMNSTNLKTQNLALSSITYLGNSDILQTVFKDLLMMAKSGARDTLLQKKALCGIKRALTINPTLVGNFITETQLVVENLKDPTLIYCYLGIYEEIAKNHPKLTPFIIKPLYSLLDNKHNWVIISSLKLMTSLIEFEPRLSKKLETKLFTIFSSSGGKSVESCLIEIVLKYFHTNES